MGKGAIEQLAIAAMRVALEEAQLARRENELPYGAVIMEPGGGLFPGLMIRS